MTSQIYRTLRHLGFAFVALFALAAGAQAHSPGEPVAAKGYAIMKAGGVLEPFEFKRRPVGDDDILIEILYSGICHSDIHHGKGDWGNVNYPIVPGHEIVGRVAAIGKNVTKFKVGDIAGVGCMVDSCGTCAFCQAGREQFCLKGATFTYGAPGVYGGYSNNLVVTQRFALRIPDGIPPEQAAPLLCAGITTWSPLKKLNIQKGQKVAIAGLGGLGHMALQYARIMGAEVDVFEITDAKKSSAKKLGAKGYYNTAKDPKAFEKQRWQYDAIISTIPDGYQLDPFVAMLKPEGTMVLLGLPAISQGSSPLSINSVIKGGRKIMGSLIGGIAETQEMLEYSAKYKAFPLVKVIPIQKLNEAWESVIKGEVQYRYVIDMTSLK